jgi:RimJ/RimL family protein N-acetyltransferase
MDFEVRRLREADAEAYRAIRLEALERYPEAFQSTYESAAELPLEAYVQRLERYALFGGFIDDELAGFVGFHRFTNPKISHKAILWGMYVREAARGTGVAEAMVKAVLDHARDQVEQILISVITNNERARHLLLRRRVPGAVPDVTTVARSLTRSAVHPRRDFHFL